MVFTDISINLWQKLLLLIDGEHSITEYAKASNCTYYYASRATSFMEKHGLLKGFYKGRERIVLLTPNGRIMARSLEKAGFKADYDSYSYNIGRRPKNGIRKARIKGEEAAEHESQGWKRRRSGMDEYDTSDEAEA